MDELRSLKGSKKISNYCNPFFPNLITIERLVELGYNHRYLAKGNRASKTKRLLILRKYTCKVFSYTKYDFGSVEVYLCIFVREHLSIDNCIVSENWDHE